LSEFILENGRNWKSINLIVSSLKLPEAGDNTKSRHDTNPMSKLRVLDFNSKS